MNVVLTTDYFPPHVGGGVEQATYQIASQLSLLGHNVAVVTLNTCSASSHEVMDRVRVYRADVVQLTGRIGLQSGISIDALQLIRRVCRREHADVLHANNIFFFTSVAACASKGMTRTHLVTTMHIGSISELSGVTGTVSRAYEGTIGRWILKESDHVIAVSEAVKTHAEKLGQPDWKVSVIANAIDTEEFSPSEGDRHDNVVRIAFVGRLVSNKGPQFLMEAAPMILRDCPRADLVFVGEGPMLESLETRARQLGLSEKVHFPGKVPVMSQFLRSCDIVVRPSLTEGMPLLVLEAMACGVPVVASEVGGTSEILHNGEAGFLSRPADVKDLSTHVARLAVDDALRRRMGRNARRYAEKHGTWKEATSRVAEIYDSVCR